MIRIAPTLALALVALVGASQTQAQPAAPAAAAPATTVGANLNISPKRVTFDRNRRTATVYIYNQGAAAASFDVGLVDRTMLPDGQILAVDDATQRADAKTYAEQVKSAQKMLLVSPRRVTLAPGQGQTVRLRVGATTDTAPAEYRSHLTITTIPPRDAGLTAEAAAGLAPNELRFQINSIFGLSIPAIVRVGDLDVRASLENVRVEYAEVSPDGRAPPRRTPMLVADITRLGANSLFGNVEVRPVGKANDVIGIARGVGVYTEVPRRTVRIPLNRAPAPGEKLEVTFTDDDTSPGKLLAKQAL